jgi:hypothetical protein
MYRLLLAAALATLAPAAHAADAQQMEANKKAVLKFIGSRYVQHKSARRRRAGRTEGLPRFPAREISRLSQRHQARFRRRRLCHRPRPQRAVPREPRRSSSKTARSSSTGTCARRFRNSPPIPTQCSSAFRSVGALSAHSRVSGNPDESAETSVTPLGPRLRGNERMEKSSQSRRICSSDCRHFAADKKRE